MEDIDADDDFQDACETQEMPVSMGLDRAISEAKVAVHYFFDNKFDEAKSLMEPWARSSLYHSVGHSVFAYLEAVLTFEQQHIEKASEALKSCISLCNKYRKKNTLSESLGKMVKKVDYNQYSPDEIHAELCYAEALLLQSVLTFMKDETLVSFIKAGLKIRSCFNSYKECDAILKFRQWGNEKHKVHFESGVHMGIGTFNLMISLLPARVIKLLEFVGLSGDKKLGLKELEAGYRLQDSIRQVLCVMTLLGYHLIVVHVLSHIEGDLEFCEEILNSQLKMYPKGVWFMFFQGRLEFMKCNINESISWYTQSWKSQDKWPQFHHLCFWELMWTNCVLLNWREASKFANYLIQESKWSKTIYTYLKASMLCMLTDLTRDEKQDIEYLMRDAPQWKQRIAGKSLPMEKFAIKKTERYFAQGKTLVLPAIEMLYVWNLFKILSKKWEIIENIFKIVEKSLKKLELSKEKTEYDVDNHGLLLLLKGSCLRLMNSPLQAEDCLNKVIGLHGKLKEDHYLVPYAVVELALLCRDQGNFVRASQLAEDAKKNYTGYSLESRLHFRIHAIQLEISENKDSASSC